MEISNSVNGVHVNVSVSSYGTHGFLSYDVKLAGDLNATSSDET